MPRAYPGFSRFSRSSVFERLDGTAGFNVTDFAVKVRLS